MYLSHYSLNRKPFQISTDPEFLWMGEKYKEALAVLKYGILDNRGFLLLTGDVGTGKTTLVHGLVNSLRANTLVAMVPDPDLELFDFLQYIAVSLDMNQSFKSKGEFLIKFRKFLIDNYKNDRKVLLVIDEAQRLNHEQLDEIRVLSNIEAQNTKLLNIFFVGQDEFNDILLENKNRALRQRITINYNIDPLTKSESAAYVRYRQ
ncbi:MAG: AAA family ATPase [Deltaproteobacteria bacterium]|nr:AAA family ATPase [Deltaproteobacteria bacterium]